MSYEKSLLSAACLCKLNGAKIKMSPIPNTKGQVVFVWKEQNKIKIQKFPSLTPLLFENPFGNIEAVDTHLGLYHS